MHIVGGWSSWGTSVCWCEHSTHVGCCFGGSAGAAPFTGNLATCTSCGIFLTDDCACVLLLFQTTQNDCVQYQFDQCHGIPFITSVALALQVQSSCRLSANGAVKSRAGGCCQQPGSASLAAVCSGNMWQLCDFRTRAAQMVCQKAHANDILAADYAQSRPNMLATGAQDGRVKVWDTRCDPCASG
jgi:hypothetical protein